MSTPTDPLAGQNVSADFLAELNLIDVTPTDPAAIARATGAYAQAQARERAAAQAVREAEKAANTKGLSAAAKKVADARLKGLQRILTGATNQAKAAQNTLFEAKGEYENLLEGPGRDAFMALRTMFNQFGLGSLAGKIYEYTKQGYGADTISLLLQDTSEYKQRFAGNTARIAKGLPVLSPAEYLSVESAYRQVLSDAGLPKGYYDNPADFTKWISDDVSPTEIKSRVDIATAEVTQFDAVAKNQLALFYGVSDKDLVAYALDRTRGVALLQKQAAAAQFAGEAARRGLATDRGRFEDYITMGLSQSQAAQGFQAVSEELPNLIAIAQRFGTDFDQIQAEQAIFGTSGNAATKRRGLASQERALFGSSQGSSAGGLGAGYRQT